VTKEEKTKNGLEVENTSQEDEKDTRKEEEKSEDSGEIKQEQPVPPAPEEDKSSDVTEETAGREEKDSEVESLQVETQEEESSEPDEGKPDVAGSEDEDTSPDVAEEKEETTVDTENVSEESSPAVESYGIVDDETSEDEQQYSSKEYDFFEKMYTETLNEILEGEIVSGKILSINDKEVAVDIGFKSEGTIPIEEFENPDNLKVGEEIEVYLDSIENKDGQLVLSKEKANFTRVWEKIVHMYENDEIIEGKCVRRIKGGMVVDLMGIDAFLPGSQIDVKPIRDFDAYVGKTLQLKVVKVNHLRKNIVVSRRVIIEESLSKQREQILAELQKGQVREGVVKNITDFGVFIDLGGVDGLLHITDLSWGRVSHPSEIVDFDQKIEVMVLDFDENKSRISLGLKQLLSPPWENIEDKYPVGKRVTGKVVSITDYGAFVELEKGVEGLIHVSEMSWTQHIMHPSKLLQIGEEVDAVILSIDKESKKISLGLKQTEPDPWLTLEKKYPVGSVHKGIVRNLTHFGVFVELEDGIDGLVHISDLSWTRKVRHPSEMVKKGDEIDVVVLNISRQDRRISLGHKQIDENPWDRFEKLYVPGINTTGKVVRLIEKGVIVELPAGVEGFVPSNHLSPEAKKSGEKSLVDSELQLKVIEFDKENKKIVLSQVDFLKDSEKKDLDDFMSKQVGKKPGEGTIGEMVPEFKEIRDRMHIEIEEVKEKEIEKKKETEIAEKPEESKETEQKKEDKAEKKVEEKAEAKKIEEDKKEEKEEEKKKEEKEKEPEEKNEKEEKAAEEKATEEEKPAKEEKKKEKTEKEIKVEEAEEKRTEIEVEKKVEKKPAAKKKSAPKKKPAKTEKAAKEKQEKAEVKEEKKEKKMVKTETAKKTKTAKKKKKEPEKKEEKKSKAAKKTTEESEKKPEKTEEDSKE